MHLPFAGRAGAADEVRAGLLDRVGALLGLFFCLSSRPVRADELCASTYTGPCSGEMGTADICQASGTTIVCDLARNGESGSATAFAFLHEYDANQYQIMGISSGSDEPIADFCCVFDATSYTRVEVLGSESNDEIYFNANGDLRPYSTQSLVGKADGRDGDDLIYGSNSEDADYLDDLYGGAGADEIHALNGDDQISGNDGTDTLYGQNGDDIIDGGPDSDVLLDGGDGTDEIAGGSGDDLIHGSDGGDIINGNDGADTICGDICGTPTGDGSDTIHGDSGNDTISGEAETDFIYGDLGNDTITGDGGADFLYGGSDQDTISGGDGDDEIDGQGGADTVNGDDGDDIVHGGSHNDVVIGSVGSDQLFGDADNDTLCGGLEPGGGALYRDHLWGGPGDDTLWGPASICSSGIENDGGGDAGTNDYCDNCSTPGYDTTCEHSFGTKPGACP